MIRWEKGDPRRMHAQEQALLSICDRVQTIEQLMTIDLDRTRALGVRLDRLERKLDALLAVLEREG